MAFAAYPGQTFSLLKTQTQGLPAPENVASISYTCNPNTYSVNNSTLSMTVLPGTADCYYTVGLPECADKDLNQDGTIDQTDYNVFVVSLCYHNRTRLDINHDCLLNTTDQSEFINHLSDFNYDGVIDSKDQTSYNNLFKICQDPTE